MVRIVIQRVIVGEADNFLLIRTQGTVLPVDCASVALNQCRLSSGKKTLRAKVSRN